MKRASYRHAINWIAQNDSDADSDRLDPEAVGNLVSAVLVADVFDVPSDKVGADIVKRRRVLDKQKFAIARLTGAVVLPPSLRGARA